MSCFRWIVGGITISLPELFVPLLQYLRQGILTFDGNLVLVIDNAITIRSRANKVVCVSIGVTFK